MAVSLKAGVLCFRHPMVEDKDGYGKVIRKAIGKLPPLDQEQAKLDLEKILGASPQTREDAAPLKACKAALDAYFDPLTIDDGKQKVLNYAATVVMELAQAQRDGLIDKSAIDILKSSEGKKSVDIRLLRRLLARITALLTECNKLAKEQDDARDQLSGYVKATGEQTAEQKTITLEQCLAHFKAHVTCKSLPTKRRLLRRVSVIVDALGEVGSLLNRCFFCLDNGEGFRGQTYSDGVSGHSK